MRTGSSLPSVVTWGSLPRVRFAHPAIRELEQRFPPVALRLPPQQSGATGDPSAWIVFASSDAAWAALRSSLERLPPGTAPRPGPLPRIPLGQARR